MCHPNSPEASLSERGPQGAIVQNQVKLPSEDSLLRRDAFILRIPNDFQKI
jgi:hypothetical protein